MNIKFNPLSFRTLRFAAAVLLPALFVTAQAVNNDDIDAEEVVNLSPFVVDTATDEGYVATQTLAGGRLNQSLKDTGAAIQVITKDFMDDIGATSIEELLQYTTSSEVAGILGNFTGADEGGAGEVSTGSARRNPDGATRIRGLAAPDRTRNFFKTDIPFDTYNTERVDINRGANSFLFGLGSPAGLINNGLAVARFKDSSEISTRVGSGGKDPSYRATFKFNRVLIEDKLAVKIAGLTDRTQYRQRPTYKDDDRVYGTFTFRPFGTQSTVIKGHFENGSVVGNAPDVLLPINNLSTFVSHPQSFDIFDNVNRFNNNEGPNIGQWRNNRNVARFVTAEERANWPMYTDANGNQQPLIRNSIAPSVYKNISWGNMASGFIFDGSNGREPSMAYTDQYPGAGYLRNDDFWDAGNRGRGAPQRLYPGNLKDINGTGWLDQGFVDLETFDFSTANLGWDNDFYTRDFENFNLSLEQTLLDGKAGITLAWDYQDLFRENYTAFNGANSQVTFDVNRDILLPTQAYLDGTGPADTRPNPNFGRPVVLTKSARNQIDEQRESLRVTAFIKHDFRKDSDDSFMAKVLGEHTLTFLGDQNTYDERRINFVQNSFGDPDPALHITTANARQTANNVRNIPVLAYVGPNQSRAFGDSNWSLNDFQLTPAKYDIRRPQGFTIDKLSWNLGPDASNDNIGVTSGANSVINGNESWQVHQLIVNETPSKNYRKQRTEITSAALNTQSKMFNDHFVMNMGYRQDTIKNSINTEADLIGLDEVPNLTDESWTLAKGISSKLEETTFGYGGVLYWPKNIIPLPEMFNDITFHYNTSDNFIPATDRVDEIRNPVEAPRGESQDWGISFYMMENKVTARLNWYSAKLLNATSPVSNVYNQVNSDLFNWFGRLNRDLMRYDANSDGQLDQEYIDELLAPDGDGVSPFDPGSGLNDEGLTIDQAVAQLFPGITAGLAARADVEPMLTDALKVAYNYRLLATGASQTQWAGAITDTQDIDASGFEGEIILNPTRNWRIAFNAARQETVLTNVAPRLGKLVEDFWAPHMAAYGHLDWSAPLQEVNGDTLGINRNQRLLDYFAIKGNEGKPNPEQREWRFNLITNYTFRDGGLKGLSIGGAVRYQDEFAGGYPLINDVDRGLVLPDTDNPWFGKRTMSFDATIGYRRKLDILGGVDWRMQINMRNLQNVRNDGIEVTRIQPDGTAARARFSAPAQYWLTNTFSF